VEGTLFLSLTNLVFSLFYSLRLEIERLKKENGYALQDIITDLYEKIQQAELPSETEVSMVTNMADIE
jgi:hypothetical protein